MTFDAFASALSNALGTPKAFGVALGLAVACHVAATVPAWQDTVLLWVGSETGIAGLLISMLVLAGQKREGVAIQIKLDEMILANENARNELVGLEARTAEEIEALRPKP